MQTARTTPRIYISVESSAGQLVVDGPLTLLRDLVRAVYQPPESTQREEMANAIAKR